MEIVNRKTAAQIGSTTFFTGKVCKNGHVAPRYVSTGHCVECVKEAARAYRGGLAPTYTGTPDDVDLAVADRIEALRRAHKAAVRKLEADLDLAIENARAKGEQDKRHAAARAAAVHASQAQATQQQAERQALAARVAARDAFKAGLRKCRAKIAPGHVETANAYVWAVAMARCAEVLQEDVCLGADRAYAGVQGYMMHADDVTATMDALKAYAPPSVVVPPAPEVPSDTASSDWLHQ
jgi:Skp family chaperone for outer membrane proteins